MPSYLIEASYSAEGLKGLMQDKAAGREDAVSTAVAGLGGKLESLYYCFGEFDVVFIADLPDDRAAFALVHTISASGLVRTRTTPLLTIQDTDLALEKTVEYREPGQYLTCPGFRPPDTNGRPAL